MKKDAKGFLVGPFKLGEYYGQCRGRDNKDIFIVTRGCGDRGSVCSKQVCPFGSSSWYFSDPPRVKYKTLKDQYKVEKG